MIFNQKLIYPDLFMYARFYVQIQQTILDRTTKVSKHVKGIVLSFFEKKYVLQFQVIESVTPLEYFKGDVCHSLVVRKYDLETLKNNINKHKKGLINAIGLLIWQQRKCG